MIILNPGYGQVMGYRFRADYLSTQYWTDPVGLVTFQENSIETNLDLSVLNLTANPHYARVDGMAPEKQKILLASTDPQLPYDTMDANNHAVYYFVNDHLGTPLKIMESQGQIVWSADYKPFGQTQVSNSPIENGLRFPGQDYDAETGLHYNWHRYYDSVTGRYLTPDPIGLAGGINPFVYTQNDPVNKIAPDPPVSGKMSPQLKIKFGALRL